MKYKDTVIYVDVDDTLARSFGTKVIPMITSIKAIERMKDDGATLYLWSSGGADYCRRVAAQFDITHLFTDFLPKPHIMVDDVRPDDWRFLKVLHPNDLVSLFDDEDTE